VSCFKLYSINKSKFLKGTNSPKKNYKREKLFRTNHEQRVNKQLQKLKSATLDLVRKFKNDKNYDAILNGKFLPQSVDLDTPCFVQDKFIPMVTWLKENEDCSQEELFDKIEEFHAQLDFDNREEITYYYERTWLFDYLSFGRWYEHPFFNHVRGALERPFPASLERMPYEFAFACLIPERIEPQSIDWCKPFIYFRKGCEKIVQIARLIIRSIMATVTVGESLNMIAQNLQYITEKVQVVVDMFLAVIEKLNVPKKIIQAYLTAFGTCIMIHALTNIYHGNVLWKNIFISLSLILAAHMFSEKYSLKADFNDIVSFAWKVISKFNVSLPQGGDMDDKEDLLKKGYVLVANFICSAFSQWDVLNKVDWLSGKAKKFFQFRDKCLTLTDHFRDMMEWVQIVIDKIMTYFGWNPGDFIFLSTNKVRLDTLRKTVHTMITEIDKSTFEFDATSYGKLEACNKEYNSILQETSKADLSSSYVGATLRAVANSIDIMRKMFRVKGWNKQGSKMEPVPLMIYGASSVFKSNIIKYLSSILVKCVLPRKNLQESNFDIEKYVYARNPSQEYWDAYSSEKIVCLFDDFGQTRDVAGSGVSEALEAIRCINGFPYPLHMAAIEDKANTYFNCQFVVATTNTRDPQFQSITHMNAYKRRWTHFYEQEIRPQYLYDLTDRSSRNVNFDLLRNTPADPAHVTPDVVWFHKLDREGNRTGDQPISFDDLVKILLDDWVIKSRIFKNDGIQMQSLSDITAENLKQSNPFLPQGEDLEEEKVEETIYTPQLGCRPKQSWRGYVASVFRNAYQSYRNGTRSYVENQFSSTLNCCHRRSYASFHPLRADKSVGSRSFWWFSGFNILKHTTAVSSCVLKLMKAGLGNLADSLVSCKGELDALEVCWTDLTVQYPILDWIEFVVKASAFLGLTTLAFTWFLGKNEPEKKKSEAIEPQMLNTYDPNGKQIIDSIVSKNLLAMESPLSLGRVRVQGHVLAIKENIILVPWHYGIALQKKRDENHLGDSLVRFYNFSRTINVSCTLNDIVSQWEHANVLTDEYYKREFFPVRLECPHFQNIYHHFATDKEILEFKTTPCALVAFHNKHDISYYQSIASVTKRMPMCCSVAPNGEKVVENLMTYPSVATTVGDCGAPLICLNRNSNLGTIFGFHIGQMPTSKMGISAIVTKELIDYAIKHMKEKVPVSMLDIEQVVPQAMSLDLKPLFQVTQTKIRRSVLSCFQRTMAPAPLRPFKDGDKLIDPYQIALSKYIAPKTAVPNKDFLFHAVNHYTNDLLRWPSQFDKRILTFEEAVCGIEGQFGSINRGSSTGYPYNVTPGLRTRKEIFGDLTYFDLTRPGAVILRRDVDRYITSCRNGQRSKVYVQDCSKDERRPFEKVYAGKTRLFSAYPLHYLMAVRMYCGAFMIYFNKNKVINGSAIGVNPYSDEWDYITQLIIHHNGGRTCGAGDFSGFDASQLKEILMYICNIINIWYDDEHSTVRETMFMEVYNSLHIHNDLEPIYWDGSLASGNPLTAIINTMYNGIAFRYCWARCFGIQALEEFGNKIFFIALGDDNIYSVDYDRIAFSELVVGAYMEELGLKYTSETKGNLNEFLRDFREIEFLKRKFRFGEYRYEAPLNIKTIKEMVLWTKKSDPDGITIGNVQNALYELALHGPSTFKTYRDIILKDFVRFYNLMDLPHITYERCHNFMVDRVDYKGAPSSAAEYISFSEEEYLVALSGLR